MQPDLTTQARQSSQLWEVEAGTSQVQEKPGLKAYAENQPGKLSEIYLRIKWR